MNNKASIFIGKIKEIGKNLLLSVTKHPVEFVLLLYATIVFILGVTIDHEGGCFYYPMPLIPFLVITAYSLSFYQKRNRLFFLLYLLPIPLCTLCLLFPQLPEFIDSYTYYILLIVFFLWMFIRAFLSHNEDFIERNAVMARSAVLAAFCAGVIYLLYFLIINSFIFIFDLPGNKEYTMSISMAYIAFVLIMPMLFFTMEDSAKTFQMSRFLKAILNWVLTPALLIYTIILYVYAVKILVTWTLPKGMISIMIFIFGLVAMFGQMMQHFCDKKPFHWFYRNFSWFALPLLVMFWIGTARRISDYGLTTWRFYLIVCGLLMTLYFILFLFKNKKGYFILTLSAAILFLLSICIPPISAKQIALYSQVERVRNTAKQIGMLDDHKMLRTDLKTADDTLHLKEHRTIYQSLRYIEDEADFESEKSLGKFFNIRSADDYLKNLSPKTVAYATQYSEPAINEEEDQTKFWVNLPSKDYKLPIEDYQYLITSNDYGPSFAHIEQFKDMKTNQILDQILETQLKKCGYVPGTPITEAWCDCHAEELLIYTTDSACIVFSSWYLNVEDDQIHIESWSIDYTLVK